MASAELVLTPLNASVDERNWTGFLLEHDSGSHESKEPGWTAIHKSHCRCRPIGVLGFVLFGVHLSGDRTDPWLHARGWVAIGGPPRVGYARPDCASA